MPRIVEADRLPMVDGNIGHYGQANTINGTAIELVTGFGLPQLIVLRDLYQAKTDAIRELEETTLPVSRAERDAIWGISPTDDQGVWFWLTQYKNLVKVRLGARHPLARTIPNFGDVVIYRYAGIIQQFLGHWALVNAALTPDMTLGAFTITTLQTALTNLQAKLSAISAGESELALHREERDQLFGDEPEEVRDPASLVARLELYHGIIQTMFPNQPLSDSLPNIFPPRDQQRPDNIRLQLVGSPRRRNQDLARCHVDPEQRRDGLPQGRDRRTNRPGPLEPTRRNPNQRMARPDSHRRSRPV